MLNNNLENETHTDKVKRLCKHPLKAEFRLTDDVLVKVNNVRDFINLICKAGDLEKLRQNSQFFYKVRW